MRLLCDVATWKPIPHRLGNLFTILLVRISVCAGISYFPQTVGMWRHQVGCWRPRTSGAEHQETQRRIRGGRSRPRGGKPSDESSGPSGLPVAMRRLDTEEACLLMPFSGTRLQVVSLPLEEAVWWHQVGSWRPEPVKWKIRKHRGGAGEGGIGTEEASLSSPSPSQAHLAARCCVT